MNKLTFMRNNNKNVIFLVFECFLERSQLLLAQLYFVGDLAGVDQQLGFHRDEMIVVRVLVGRQIPAQYGRHEVSAPVDVLLQLLGLFQLTGQLALFLLQRLLRDDKRCYYIIAVIIDTIILVL